MYQSAFSANRLMTLTHYKGINLLIKLLDDLFNFVCLNILMERNTLLNTFFLCYIKGVDIIEGVPSFLPISYMLSTRCCRAYDYEIVPKPTVVNRKVIKIFGLLYSCSFLPYESYNSSYAYKVLSVVLIVSLRLSYHP
jgi:hypothetical protein